MNEIIWKFDTAQNWPVIIYEKNYIDFGRGVFELYSCKGNWFQRTIYK
jgi:hypothetical protein